MKSIMSKTNARQRVSGFSVLELMIALAVCAILLAGTGPAFSAVVHKNRISAATNQLYMSLHAARGEALKRRSAVRICPSANSTSCRTDGDWSDGWLIYEDVNTNNAPDAAEIIQLIDGLDGEINMQVSTALSEYVQFQPTGAAIGNGGNTGEFRLCHSDSSVYSKAVNISVSGRVNSVTRARTDCDAS